MVWNKRNLRRWAVLTLSMTGTLSVGAADLDQSRLDPRLQQMMAFRDGRLPLDAPFAPPSVRSEQVRVYLTFGRAPGAGDLRELEQRGVRFTRLGQAQEPAHIGRIYGVQVPWASIPVLAADPRIERIEAVERRGQRPTMDLSMPEIQVATERFVPRASTDGLTGRGQIIADFDTSVDLYHPALFKPDGGLYEWLDADEDGAFTPGIDAVDLDGSGSVQEGETLRLLENAEFDVQYGPLTDGYLDVDQDWLYADSDGDGARDYGIDAGYGESDAAYGEPLFFVDDEDGNGELDPGERLVRLKTSKVLAGLDGESAAVTHTRGSDLLTLTPDLYPHGTSVAGILAGDWPGRRFTGVAPEAELIEVDYEAAGIDMVSAISWAKDQGADVMLYEFGNWSGEFLDGSSALEAAITSTASGGIPQVCPSGNIGQNNKHGKVSVPAGGSALAIFFVDSSYGVNATYLTGLWRQSNPVLSFSLEFVSADGIGTNTAITASSGQTKSNSEGDYVYALSSTSSRNTKMMDMTLYHQSDGVTTTMTGGLYYLTVTNTGSSSATLHLFLADDQSSWSGGATWITSDNSSPGAIADPAYSVSSPATADGCITVGSYATRQQEVLGDLSTFSGRGPRIDETSLVDVAAPGNYDIISPTSAEATYYDASIQDFPNYPHGSSWLFGGTSAAAPHVAGAAALLKQLDSSLTHDEIESAMRDGAAADSYTGSVPNESWGMGKLRVGNSLQKADGGGPTFTVLVDRHPLLSDYLVVTIAPSERLAEPPTLSSPSIEVGAVVSAGDDLYTATFPAPASGSSLSLTVSSSDQVGNAGSSTGSYSF